MGCREQGLITLCILQVNCALSKLYSLSEAIQGHSILLCILTPGTLCRPEINGALLHGEQCGHSETKCFLLRTLNLQWT